MLGKALHLLEKAKELERKEKEGIKVGKQNPYRKAWGLQKDGDLWEIAWAAILKRGAASQTIRKVKGHATKADIVEGKSNEEDKKGNDKADANADIGVQMIRGKGLVALAKWTADRHGRYILFMRRIQHFVAAVLKAEKDIRANRNKTNKSILGYDPTKWIKTIPKIRNGGEERRRHVRLEMARPARGQHRFKHCHGLYLDIHQFLRDREWAAADNEGDTSGSTWIELFVLFDITAARTQRGQHIKDIGAKVRADARNKKKEAAQRRKQGDASACVKPSLDEELKRFKAIVRHIGRHETGQEHAGWFDMERRANLRRLGDLAVVGNQPAIMATVRMSDAEKAKVTRCIMLQKIGSDAKCMKRYDELVQQQDGTTEEGVETMLIKFGRIATGCTVRWKREMAETQEQDEQGPRKLKKRSHKKRRRTRRRRR
jgi:hypothetical protein